MLKPALITLFLASSLRAETLLVLNKRDATLAFVDPAAMKVVAKIPTGEGHSSGGPRPRWRESSPRRRIGIRCARARREDGQEDARHDRAHVRQDLDLWYSPTSSQLSMR